VKHLLRHLPFLLVILLIGWLGFTDLSMSFGPRVLVTCLAPALWAGLYLLGKDRSSETA
jgi:hypothetical protein